MADDSWGDPANQTLLEKLFAAVMVRQMGVPGAKCSPTSSP